MNLNPSPGFRTVQPFNGVAGFYDGVDLKGRDSDDFQTNAFTRHPAAERKNGLTSNHPSINKWQKGFYDDPNTPHTCDSDTESRIRAEVQRQRYISENTPVKQLSQVFDDGLNTQFSNHSGDWFTKDANEQRRRHNASQIHGVDQLSQVFGNGLNTQFSNNSDDWFTKDANEQRRKHNASQIHGVDQLNRAFGGHTISDRQRSNTGLANRMLHDEYGRNGQFRSRPQF